MSSSSSLPWLCFRVSKASPSLDPAGKARPTRILELGHKMLCVLNAYVEPVDRARGHDVSRSLGGTQSHCGA
jgi:hypothetical protein